MTIDPGADLQKILIDTLLILIQLLLLWAVKTAVTWVKAHTNEKQQHTIREIAEWAVSATEQIAATQFVANKLSHATARAKELAARHGLTLSDEQWRTMMEPFVRYMHSFDMEQVSRTAKAPVGPPDLSTSGPLADVSFPQEPNTSQK